MRIVKLALIHFLTIPHTFQRETEYIIAVSGWLALLVTVMLTCYGLSLAAIVLLYYYYTGQHTGDCKLHEFFISFNMLLCVGLSIVSILPQVQGKYVQFRIHNTIISIFLYPTGCDNNYSIQHLIHFRKNAEIWTFAIRSYYVIHDVFDLVING